MLLQVARAWWSSLLETNWRVISQHANTEHHKATIEFLKERPNQKFHMTLLRLKKCTLVEMRRKSI